MRDCIIPSRSWAERCGLSGSPARARSSLRTSSKAYATLIRKASQPKKFAALGNPDRGRHR